MGSHSFWKKTSCPYLLLIQIKINGVMWLWPLNVHLVISLTFSLSLSWMKIFKPLKSRQRWGASIHWSLAPFLLSGGYGCCCTVLTLSSYCCCIHVSHVKGTVNWSSQNHLCVPILLALASVRRVQIRITTCRRRKRSQDKNFFWSIW